MVAAEVAAKNEVSVEEFEAVKSELNQVKKELEQYKNAYRDQNERYNRLFGLFANNIDYFVAGSKGNNQ